MRVVAVPCLSDNYAYLVIDEASGQAAVVDPGESAPIEAAVAREKVELVAIWATHHHADHVGGAGALLDAHAGAALIAHRTDALRISRVTRLLDDGDAVALGALRATVIHNPGHTLGAISFFLAGAPGEAGAVFTGDTLFGAGCGRVFEGTAAMMYASLARLAALPGDTRAYFGHEYTVANLRFAAAVEPRSHAIADRAAATEAARDRGVPSTPSTISDERSTNPFLRVAEPAVMAAAAARTKTGSASGDPVAVFAAIREWKNDFR